MLSLLPPKLLVLENKNINNAIFCNTIERSCFNVVRYTDFKSVLDSIHNVNPNIIIISSRIDGISPIEFVVRLNKQYNIANTPVIFLIDQDESVENYEAVNYGFLECVKRPIDVNNVIYVIKSLLRKSNQRSQKTILSYKGLNMNLANYEVVYNTTKISLCPMEFKILQFLLRNPGTVYSRQEIINNVVDQKKHDKISQRTIDVHVNRIRKLMHNHNDNTFLIKTIRSMGYCLM